MVRLLPLFFVAMSSVLVPSDRADPIWLLILRAIAFCAPIAALLYRRRLSGTHMAMICAMSFYVFAICDFEVANLSAATALGFALMIVVTQLTMTTAKRWLANVTCVASLAGASALAYFGALAHEHSIQWIYVSITFVCFAFMALAQSSAPVMQKLNDDRIPKPEQDRHNSPIKSGAPPVPNRNFETIAYAISHDLRAPLRAIEGFGRMLASDLGDKLSPAAARDLEGIRASVERMQAMTSRWLRLASVENEAFAREAVNLSTLVQSLYRDLRVTDHSRSVAISIQPDVIADADPILAHELLQNLIGNAWKFTQHNSDSGLIEFGSLRKNGELLYFVRDNGVGFAAADTDKLFHPFKRLHSNDQYGGTGIGLVIAKRIVELHLGRIWAEAQADRGATIWFTLPEAVAVTSN
jgi:signal transduction histidine kinase